MTDSQPRLLTADILYTGMGLPINNGAVVVSGGTIAAAGAVQSLRSAYPHALEERAGRVIAPPPLNAHAHLDMTRYDFKALPYFRWIPEVVMANRERRGLEGAQAGLAAVRASGAAALGDIVWHPDVMRYLLEDSDLPGIAYWEVLDPNPASAQDTFRRTVERVEAWRKLERPGAMRVGLSPHATYTVSHKLLCLLAEYARLEDLPLQIHVAEHGSELEFFTRGEGELAASFMRAMAALQPGLTIPEILGRSPDPQLTPVQYLAELGVLNVKPTLVHVVHATEDDARILAQTGCAVVSCPRSNHHLSCGTFNWSMFARHGVEVALGTDSVASGETLNIFDEYTAAREMHQHLDERMLVRALVKGGSRVLGLKVPFIRRAEPWRPEYVWPELGERG